MPPEAAVSREAAAEPVAAEGMDEAAQLELAMQASLQGTNSRSGRARGPTAAMVAQAPLPMMCELTDEIAAPSGILVVVLAGIQAAMHRFEVGACLMQQLAMLKNTIAPAAGAEGSPVGMAVDATRAALLRAFSACLFVCEEMQLSDLSESLAVIADTAKSVASQMGTASPGHLSLSAVAATQG